MNGFEVFSEKKFDKRSPRRGGLDKREDRISFLEKCCSEEVSTMPSELITWRHERERLKQEMNQLYEKFLDLGPLRRFDAAWAWVPVIDMSESGSHITVHAEIPGMEPKNIKVSL